LWRGRCWWKTSNRPGRHFLSLALSLSLIALDQSSAMREREKARERERGTAGLPSKPYVFASFLYLIRRGFSASSPTSSRLFAMYAW
jgi:hypothetical protein